MIDWLIDKNLSGYKMVNSVARLEQTKQFMRGQLQEWNLPCWSEFSDHPDERHPGSLLPDVLVCNWGGGRQAEV